MSVTFYADNIATDAQPVSWNVECGCGAGNEAFSDQLDAQARQLVIIDSSAKVSGCDEDYCLHAYVIPQFDVEPSPEVNVSNANARAFLSTIGIDGDDVYCGEMDGTDFAARILTAEALSVGDAGVPAIVEGNMIDCGRPEGYFDNLMIRMTEVADFARENKVMVRWS